MIVKRTPSRAKIRTDGIVPDPRFKTGTLGDWQIARSGSGVTHSIVDGRLRHVTTTPATTDGASIDLSGLYTPGVTYRVQMRFRDVDSTGARIRFYPRWHHTSSLGGGTIGRDTTPGAGVWYQLDEEFTPESGDDYFGIITIMNSGTTFEFDDVFITPK